MSARGRTSSRAGAAGRARSGRASSRRGFALPLVLMLALVTGVLLSAILTRQSAQTLAVGRTLAGVQNDHFGKGLREVVDSFLTSAPSSDLRRLMTRDGTILRLDMPDGRAAIVSARDAQGTLLGSTRGMSPAMARIMRPVIDRLRRAQDLDPDAEPLLRDTGPRSAALSSIDPGVLRTVLEEAGAADAETGVRWLEETREARDLNDSDLGVLLDRAGLPGDSRERASNLLSATTELWEITVELEGSARDEPRAFRGLAWLRPSAGVGGTLRADSGEESAALPNGVFVTFDRVDPERARREREERGLLAPRREGRDGSEESGAGQPSGGSSGARSGGRSGDGG